MESFSIGNVELEGAPALTEGQVVVHIHGDGTEEEALIENGRNVATGEESSTIQCYTLSNGKSYIAGVYGKKIPRRDFRLK